MAQSTTMDLQRFYAQTLEIARRTLSSAYTVRQAAREALQEAHSSLGQADFFAGLDACGGPHTLIERLAHDLEAVHVATPGA